MTAFFLEDRAELYRTFLAFGLNCAICFPIFISLSVEYPRVLAIPHTVFGDLLRFVHVLDRPVNCFPSHHIATSFTNLLRDRAAGPPLGGRLPRRGHPRRPVDRLRQAALRRGTSRPGSPAPA
jgi:hypothetical protein